jgi:hypothetical protein
MKTAIVKNATMEERIAHFGEMICGLGMALQTAGEYLVSLLDEDPAVKKKIQAKFPEIGMSVLNQLEAVGRGTLHPRLTMVSNPGFVRLRGLPMSDQTRYLEEPVELVLEKDGEFDTLLVKAVDLTPEQAKQVFAADHVRDQGAQRAWLEGERAKAEVEKRTTPIPDLYVVHRDGIVEFRAGARIPMRELAAIVARGIKA